MSRDEVQQGGQNFQQRLQGWHHANKKKQQFSKNGEETNLRLPKKEQKSPVAPKPNGKEIVFSKTF